MRVISGTARGRVLKAPSGKATRPTLQHVKESIFNILGDIVVGVDVLDLFAGSGSLGIEALSRGARSALFIDSDFRAVRAIRQNLDLLDMCERGQIRKAQVYQFIETAHGSGLRFGLVFADPPYERGHEELLLKKLADCPIIAPGGILILEHSRRTETPEASGTLVRRDLKRYGDTHVSIYLG